MKPKAKLTPGLGIRNIQPHMIRRIFSQFGRHIRPHRSTLILAWACMLAATVAELLRPWPIKLVFDAVLAPRTGAPLFGSSLLPEAGPGMLLALVALSIVVIAFAVGAFRYGETFLLGSVGHKVVTAIRRQLYDHIQRLSRSFHDTHHSGDLLVRLTGDITLLRDLLLASVLFISENLLLVLGMAAVMFWMDWRLALVAVGVLPILALLALRFSVMIKHATKRQRRRESEAVGVISETISAISVVQAFSRERYESERFANQDNASLGEGLRATRLEASLNRLVEIALAVGTCGVVWVGVTRVLAGHLTPGDLVVFTTYLAGMYKPIRKLAAQTNRIAKASVCGERVLSILEIEPEITDAPDAIAAPRFRGTITFEDVTFSYARGERVLDDVSFIVRPGQTAALVGASGVGKSTIASLLLRFYEPQSGRILIDGTDVRRFTLASLREQIAVVLQEAVLFGTTVRDNIAYGKLDATIDEIEAAAKAANAHDFILELADGYDTVISERGSTLSGGQRQRIAIARAIIRGAPILILDEPVAGLDIESETKVRQALERLMAGKTCLLITHDLEAARDADFVLFLEKGRIAGPMPAGSRP